MIPALDRLLAKLERFGRLAIVLYLAIAVITVGSLTEFVDYKLAS